MNLTLEIIDRLRDNHALTAMEYRSLLEDNDQRSCSYLQSEAKKAAVSEFGQGVFIRGLIEISNHCKNNCFYCGIRAANTSIKRYRLSKEEILQCCAGGYKLGFRTFVLQGGEDPVQTDEWLEDVVASIHAEYPDCCVTLSLGEKSDSSYARLHAAGAERYLLRHETHNQEHYSQLHPEAMSRDNRLHCISRLKQTGWQTGSGIMVGSPYQTTDNIVEDLMYIQELRPEMIGIGPFVHQGQTPFADRQDGSVDLTLKLISIFRLMNPKALIPATTALATLAPDGRTRGILAGANVVMPNLTPSAHRADYALYEGKAAGGAESAEGLETLKQELSTIGYEVVVGRGDYRYN